MDSQLGVTIAGVHFKNPVMTASGTFGHGEDFADFVDVSRLGGVITKGVSITPWKGNPPPRIAETTSGMLNAVGLQNPGVEVFKATAIPYLRRFNTNIIVNLCGHTLEEYVAVTEAMADADVDMFELNISCPNLAAGAGGLAFGTDPAMVEKVVGAVKKKATKPLIVKLSPNVTDITAIAKAAQGAGADALSLINTLLGMHIDIHRRKPTLANTMGGLSGPCIKPVALRMVYQAAKAVSIPIIGMGGIATGADAVEFLMAGATAVAVGSANFANPHATLDVLTGILEYMYQYNINDINTLVGAIL